jgi:magnesium transporter
MFEQGAHVILLGVDPAGHVGTYLRGQLELLVTRDGVAVLTTDVPDRMLPETLRRALEPSLERTPGSSGGQVLGLLVSKILDWYEDVLDRLEDESVSIANALFGDNRGGQLRRMYALAGPVHAASVAMQPLVREFDEFLQSGDREFDVPLAKQLRSDVQYLMGRLQRVDAVLATAQQSYFNLGQDEANRLMVRQGEVTRKLSGYALLFAIPTIVFGLYGTNFDHIPLLGESWGYAVALGASAFLCFATWWRLRRAGWI